MNKALEFIVARGREPSTYAALAVGLQSAGLNIDSDAWLVVVHMCTAAAIGLGVFLRERHHA